MSKDTQKTAARRAFESLKNFGGYVSPDDDSISLLGKFLALQDQRSANFPLSFFDPTNSSGAVTITADPSRRSEKYSNWTIMQPESSMIERYETEVLLRLYREKASTRPPTGSVAVSTIPVRNPSITYPSTPRKSKLKGKIYELLDTAGRQNWDGENADPVTKTTVTRAQSFADRLPEYVEEPDVNPTPQGEVDFDWMLPDRSMLTVSITPGGELAVAAKLSNGTKFDASFPWTGQIPAMLLACFQDLIQTGAE